VKIFYDTEFLEDGETIKLISIGLVREDGKEYYAINAELPWFSILRHDWLKKHVVSSLPTRMTGSGLRTLNFDSVHIKPRAKIAHEVASFILSSGPDPELWAWYGAYDHVALCQLWGRMTDLPPGIPMFTNDIKTLFQMYGNPVEPKQNLDTVHNALEDARHNKVMYDFIKAKAGEVYREAVLEALHPELGYWCHEEHALHTGLPPKE